MSACCVTCESHTWPKLLHTPRKPHESFEPRVPRSLRHDILRVRCIPFFGATFPSRRSLPVVKGRIPTILPGLPRLPVTTTGAKPSQARHFVARAHISRPTRNTLPRASLGIWGYVIVAFSSHDRSTSCCILLSSCETFFRALPALLTRPPSQVIVPATALIDASVPDWIPHHLQSRHPSRTQPNNPISRARLKILGTGCSQPPA